MKKWIGMLLCLVFLAGCGPKSDLANSKYFNIQEILDQAGAVPKYISIEDFTGDEREILTTLNSLMKYNLSDDIPGIGTLYSKESSSEHGNPQEAHVLSLIVSMESPKFNFTSNQNAEVYVKQSDITIADPNKNLNTADKIYYMVKENAK
ncbi:hypothetical protein [Paenibacillus solani]|uniref:hypothetical protein n=1 Tax=Paenibacillus solani TaxID=1705565 RepID=UPI003D29C508